MKPRVRTTSEEVAADTTIVVCFVNVPVTSWLLAPILLSALWCYVLPSSQGDDVFHPERRLLRGRAAYKITAGVQNIACFAVLRRDWLDDVTHAQTRPGVLENGASSFLAFGAQTWAHMVWPAFALRRL